MRLFALSLAASLAWGSNCVPAGYLGPNASVDGALSEIHCRLADGAFFSEHILHLPTHGRLSLDASSDDFAVTLLVRDSFGRLIDEGAAIRRAVERGEYSVLATSTKPATSGRFRIRSAFTPEPNTLCRTVTPLGPNRSTTGRLDEKSCQLPGGAPHDAYLVTIFGPGTLDIALEAPDLPVEAFLRNAEGRSLGSGSVAVRGDED
ncbi:MAG: hypothetical protein ACRD96_16440, partial [Bryobacteraceae bacterium]